MDTTYYVAQRSESNSTFELKKMNDVISFPELGEYEILLECTHILIMDKKEMVHTILSNEEILPLYSSVVGKVKKYGISVRNYNVGDIVYGMTDSVLQKKLNYSMNYCIIFESYAFKKPLDIPADDLLSVFSDLMQIEYLLLFLPKFPIKHSFLISSNPFIPINMLLIQKLTNLNCKLMILVENQGEANKLKDSYPDVVTIPMDSLTNIWQTISDETCSLGVSCIFHLNSYPTQNFSDQLIQSLSFNGTIIFNSIHSKNILNVNQWIVKSPLVHFFDFYATLGCHYFTTTFEENTKEILKLLSNNEVVITNKKVINYKQLHSFIETNNFLNKESSIKLIVELK